jgi:hypothetical protein
MGEPNGMKCGNRRARMRTANQPAGLERTVLLLAFAKPARLYISPFWRNEEYSQVSASPS